MKNIGKVKLLSKVKRKLKYKKIMAVLFAAMILQFVAVQGLLIFDGSSDAEKETGYLIILGTGINGETPSLALYERLFAGLKYLEKYPGVRVIVSGGQGRGEAITEAEAMRRFLVSRGIDNERILLESHSTSTMENFKFSKALIEQETGLPAPEITFITNSFHIFRSKMLAGRNKLKVNAIACKTPKQVIVQMYLREYFALFKSLLFDR